MPYARLEIVCPAFIIFILYNRSVYKYNALTKYSPIPGYVGTQENVSHNVEASLDNKPDINEETGKRRTPDEYYKLLYGVNISELQDRSYTQNEPFTYFEEYENPCWLERLTVDYMEAYTQTAYHGDYGLDQINKVIPIYNKRLKQDERPWRLRCLPYFFLLGVTKCGTTDFFNAILKHPAVHGLWIKEPMYWNRERYPGGTMIFKNLRMPHHELWQYMNMMDYAAHVINESHPDQHIIGDASSYAFYEDNGWPSHPENQGLSEPKFTTPMALHAALPKAKLIVLFRNPVNRLYSDYNMYTNTDQTRSPEHFDILVRGALDQYDACFKAHSERACIYNASLAHQVFPITITASLYCLHLREWFSVYPKDQFHIIKSEEYYENRINTLLDVFKFLHIRYVPNDTKNAITTQVPSLQQEYWDMMNSTRQLLNTFFQPFNQRLEDMLSRTFWSET